MTMKGPKAKVDGKKTGNKNSSPGKGRTRSKSPGGKKGKGRKSITSNKTVTQVDIFSTDAMENAYYTCHNVADFLTIRGFPWAGTRRKGKGKGKKKRKKK
ncbi:small lysine-rich protein 1-like [Limulus polyphemus]|uniref:Small lysine-rich protein 1-like n=1 Tax=Limulus polyphemus TaxID=6850 RepID=A0ABM1SSF4_LIMPO|nr:small lysine-rich protein 1-like [Limulus polyphemus]XP_022246560.1 small lysine-rich protein 1-like [Limulus polyphemus]